MAAPEQDPTLDDEAEDGVSDSPVSDRLLKEFFSKMTTKKLQKLTKLMEEEEDECPSPTVEALKEVSPGFKGRFSDFKLEDSYYEDFMKGLPELPRALKMAKVIPITRHVAKDVADVKALDESLMEISRNLKCIMGYMIVALDNTGPLESPDVGECMFRSLCLSASAFAKLQVERHTTPVLRKTVEDSETIDQLPKVIQQAKKNFFRSGAGARSSSQQSRAENDDEESDPPMRAKKRNIFRETRRAYRSTSAPRPRQSFGFQGRRAFGSPQRQRMDQRRRDEARARPPVRLPLPPATT
jgi:hypothetical protein